MGTYVDNLLKAYGAWTEADAELKKAIEKHAAPDERNEAAAAELLDAKMKTYTAMCERDYCWCRLNEGQQNEVARHYAHIIDEVYLQSHGRNAPMGSLTMADMKLCAETAAGAVVL